MKTIGIKTSEEEYEVIKTISEANQQSVSAFCKEALAIARSKQSLDKILQEAAESACTYQKSLSAITQETSEKMASVAKEVGEVAQTMTSTLASSRGEFEAVLAPTVRAMNDVRQASRRFSLKWLGSILFALSVTGLGINALWIHNQYNLDELTLARNYWSGVVSDLNNYLLHLYPSLGSAKRTELNELYQRAHLPLPEDQMREAK